MKALIEFTGAELALFHEAYGFDSGVWFGDAKENRRLDDGIGVYIPNHLNSRHAPSSSQSLSSKLSKNAEWAVQHFRRQREPLVKDFLSWRIDIDGNDPWFEEDGSDGTGLFWVDIELSDDFELIEENAFVGRHGVVRLALLEDAMQVIIRNSLNDPDRWYINTVRPSSHGSLPIEHLGRSLQSSALRIENHELWNGSETSNESWSRLLATMSSRWFWALANEVYLKVEHRLGAMATEAMLAVITERGKWTYRHRNSLDFRDTRVACMRWAVRRDNEWAIRRQLPTPSRAANYESCFRDLLDDCAELFSRRYEHHSVEGRCVWCFNEVLELEADEAHSRALSQSWVLCSTCHQEFYEGTTEYRARVDSKGPETELTEDDFREVFGGFDPIVTDD